MKVLIVLAVCLVASAYSRRIVINRIIDEDESQEQPTSAPVTKKTRENAGHNIAGVNVGGVGVGLDTNLLGGSDSSEEGNGNFVGLHLGKLKLGLNIGKTNNSGIGANVLNVGAGVGTQTGGVTQSEVSTSGDIFTAAGDLAAGAVKGVGNVAEGIVEAPLRVAQGVIGGTANVVGGGLQTVGHVASGLANGIGSGLHNLFSWGRK